MPEALRVNREIDEFVNVSVNASAGLDPGLVASFGLLLSACHFRDSCLTDDKLTICVFNNIPAIYA
jgi:hypothetical protein